MIRFAPIIAVAVLAGCADMERITAETKAATDATRAADTATAKTVTAIEQLGESIGQTAIEHIDAMATVASEAEKLAAELEAEISADETPAPIPAPAIATDDPTAIETARAAHAAAIAADTAAREERRQRRHQQFVWLSSIAAQAKGLLDESKWRKLADDYKSAATAANAARSATVAATVATENAHAVATAEKNRQDAAAQLAQIPLAALGIDIPKLVGAVPRKPPAPPPPLRTPPTPSSPSPANGGGGDPVTWVIASAIAAYLGKKTIDGGKAVYQWAKAKSAKP